MIAAAIIAVCVIATIAAAALAFAPRLAERKILFDRRPDKPRAFGVRMAWIAVRTRDTHRVLSVLGLADVRYANWNTGLGAVYSRELADSHVFVSPPVDGWTLIVGQALPQMLGPAFNDKLSPLLAALGSQFEEVQAFTSFSALEHYGWARFRNGAMERGFAISGDKVLWSVGKVSREEKTLGLKLFALKGVRGRKGDAGSELLLHPTEPHVLRLAGQWSLDPMRLASRTVEHGVGFVGHPPARWRPERSRLRQAA